MPKKTNGKSPHPITQPERQPDFGDGFHTADHAPVLYETRWYEGNFKHDIVYLGSYIHDATFRIKELQDANDSLVIPLCRERWELNRATGDLIQIRSRLTISPMISYTLELSDGFTLKERAPELRIGELFYLGDMDRMNLLENKPDDRLDDKRLVLCGYCFRLSIRAGDNCKVRLADLSE